MKKNLNMTVFTENINALYARRNRNCRIGITLILINAKVKENYHFGKKKITTYVVYCVIVVLLHMIVYNKITTTVSLEILKSFLSKYEFNFISRVRLPIKNFSNFHFSSSNISFFFFSFYLNFSEQN